MALAQNRRGREGTGRLPRARALVAAVLAAGCATWTGRPPLHQDSPPGTWYIVQPGETLSEIATRARVPVEDLRELNGLARAERLQAGRLIFVLYGDEPREIAEGPPPQEPGPVVTGGAAPLRWPLGEPRVTSVFGTRLGRVHEGIDLGAPIGTPIHSAGEGRVLYAGDAVRGYGHMVVLEHAGNLLTVYAHNSVVLVRTGDRIAAGQEIARVGQSGRATAPHLHFEVRKRQEPQDPLQFLPPLSPTARRGGRQ